MTIQNVKIGDNDFDFTEFVKSFELTHTVGEVTENNGEYVHTFKFPTFEPKTTLTLDPKDLNFSQMFESLNDVNIWFNGKYWFDYKYSISGKAKNLTINPDDGKYEYEIVGFAYNDTTSYHWFAKFLRWLFRRDKAIISVMEGE